MQRAFMNILAENVEETVQFYEGLLGMRRRGDFGWCVVLGHAQMPDLEMGILDRAHEAVPEQLAPTAGGSFPTFVVADLRDVERRAQNMAVEVVQPATDMPYGQRRLLVRDPAGTIVDISAPI